MENGADNRHVGLPRKIPVYITYTTAYVRDGELHFGNDLYSRDEPLVRAVMPGAQPREVVLQRLASLKELVEAEDR